MNETPQTPNLSSNSVLKNVLNAEINRCIGKVKDNLGKYQGKFPDASAERDGNYLLTDNTGWTTGFWSGQTWLCYELSGDVYFQQKGLEQVESFYKRLEDNIDLEHHDIGFLYSLSCVAASKVLGNTRARNIAVSAARKLCQRFTSKGNFIQAWGEMFAKDNYRLIIDCYMNIPLLYWAHQQTGEEIFYRIAEAHAKTALITIRKDFSTFHTYFFDLATGAPLRGITVQGYRDDSPWARGQAWIIYGMALAYMYTKDPIFIEKFVPLTRFFLKHLPADRISYWDLTFTEGDQPRDSSATAIACCGIMEMAKYLPKGKDKEFFLIELNTMMNSLIKNYTSTNEEGLITRGSYNVNPHNYLKGVDTCCSFGDYFYLEALMRMKNPDWNPYW